MHYTGMAAFEVQGHVVWDPTLVLASIVLGGLIGAVALPVGLRGDQLKWKLLGGLLLTLAICSHHFTAMGAASIIPDPTVEFSPTALPSGWLAIAVALASFIIIVLTFAGVAIELRDRRRGELEIDRMRGLADAAVEGLLVCRGDSVVTVNSSFADLVGSSAESMTRAKLEQYFPDEGTRLKLFERPNQPVEGDLSADGSRTPVELIQRAVDYGGKPSRHCGSRPASAQTGGAAYQLSRASRFLTGIPNRGTFNKRLDQEIESASGTGRRLAVLCLDLDRFKDVNDRSGTRPATRHCSRRRRDRACSTKARCSPG